MDVPPRQGACWRTAAVGLGIFLGLGGMYVSGTSPRSATSEAPREALSRARELGRPTDLPLPSRLTLPQYEEELFAFLNARRYVELGWLRDKRVRDTGPYLGGKSYGTHPAVRVYYSPGVVHWLMNGRVGKIPDGEMIVKEQYDAPAIRHEEKTEEELWRSLTAWTVMVKDSSGSHDGWFWSNPVKGQCVADDRRRAIEDPVSGFGQYCVRCHASTASPGAEPASASNEFTFAALRNIEGFPGEPILFRVDDSWRALASEERETERQKQEQKPAGTSTSTGDDKVNVEARHDAHPRCTRVETPPRPVVVADGLFLRYFDTVKPVARSEVLHLPPATGDWAVASRDPAREFATSNQCMSCHSGLVAPFGPSMFVPTGDGGGVEYGAPGRDVSPHGEWRWTPMGLAGRDPIFHAQVESEIHALREEFRSDPALAEELCATLSDTCLRCHGAMGRRQFELDHPAGTAKFSINHVLATGSPPQGGGHPAADYGALARDGVGCMVCHRMQPPDQPRDDPRPSLQFFLETSISGNFRTGKKGEIYGPFRDEEISPYAMEHATGLRPKHGEFLKSSRLCGTCHMVALPNVDRPIGPSDPGHQDDELAKSEIVPLFRKFHHHVEQATYLEWLNSEYEDEINPRNPLAKSCQDCHMPRGLKDEASGIDLPQVRTRIAAIQDTTYPEAENLAPHDRLRVRIRDEGYRRHNFAGLNVFLLELFNQFDDVLGVRKPDFMTGSDKGIAHAVGDMARTARDDVASVDVDAQWTGPDRLTARVVVRNKVGHRFPSGVGFRRAFLELLVVRTGEDRPESERLLWASGRTNALGILVGADGRPLPTESFARDPSTAKQAYQGHHEVITSPDQVQVYETLLQDARGRFTTSFVHGCETVKDNRLLPRGWKAEGPGPALTGRFLLATHPGPDTEGDPRYADGSGSDEVTYQITLPAGTGPDRLLVRATLYYQAIPPYFLRNLFETAPDGPATRRLHHMCSQVDLKGTPIAGWKLPITSAACGVGQRLATDPQLRRAR